MPENRDFSHLPLPFLYRGKPKLRGFNSPSERTNRNRNNRAHHGEYLKRRSSELSQFWKERRINRLEEDLPEIQVGIPILLEIEPSSNIEFLRGLGFEIVCEIEDGFIIVASEDIDLTRFNQKANEFIQNISLRCNTPAKVYALCEDSDRLRHIGYGIPDVHRATSNDEYRITLITPVLMELGDNEAHIFQIPIPEELSSVGEDYDILIEITLSYAANPRRTRRHIKGYLSTWLDWCCSRIGESAETFAQRIFETGSVIEDDGDFDWVLGEATNRGFADGYSRKKGTLQKDWCIIKSNQLSDAFCVAVRGHKGWGGLFKAKYSLAVSFEAINQDIPIYEPIRTEIETTIENKEIEVEMPDSK